MLHRDTLYCQAACAVLQWEATLETDRGSLVIAGGPPLRFHSTIGACCANADSLQA